MFTARSGDTVDGMSRSEISGVIKWMIRNGSELTESQTKEVHGSRKIPASGVGSTKSFKPGDRYVSYGTMVFVTTPDMAPDRRGNLCCVTCFDAPYAFNV
jgi:hypothetical protein